MSLHTFSYFHRACTAPGSLRICENDYCLRQRLYMVDIIVIKIIISVMLVVKEVYLKKLNKKLARQIVENPILLNGIKNVGLHIWVNLHGIKV